jgi:multiple sugar transport system substrate-binding protein
MGATLRLPRGRRALILITLTVLASAEVLAGCSAVAPSGAPLTLRLQVAMTPEELATFQPALQALDDAHPEWTVQLETVPQGSESERITTQLASGGLPDLLRVTGANVQQWIRREAFVELSPRVDDADIDLADFYSGAGEQFRWRDGLWGLPDSASPEIVFYNRTMFDAAGLEVPTAEWTYDDMRTAATVLTLDEAERQPDDAAFDPEAIEQWGWNGGVTYFWQNALIRARGGELCANADCTRMSFTGTANEAAFEWWVSLVRDDHAALYDPYGGSQTGVPGDPFIAGRAAMGSNGSFAIGQLRAAGAIDFGVIPPLIGVDGRRHTPLSTNGYVIAASSPNQDAAWELMQALTTPEFLASTWAQPGHAVPARRSAADDLGRLADIPGADVAIREAMEVGQVFKPYTANALAAYGATVDLFTRMNTGALPIAEALAEIEASANEALAPDRAP